MRAKNAMIHELDSNQKRVYELEAELNELKLNSASLGERCQLAESDHYVKDRELTDIAGKVPSLEAAFDEKEKDLQKALLESTSLERLLRLRRTGRVGLILIL